MNEPSDYEKYEEQLNEKLKWAENEVEKWLDRLAWAVDQVEKYNARLMCAENEIKKYTTLLENNKKVLNGWDEKK
jgi:hypothetical protein